MLCLQDQCLEGIKMDKMKKTFIIGLGGSRYDITPEFEYPIQAQKYIDKMLGGSKSFDIIPWERQKDRQEKLVK
jgi:hypothetical protein